MKELLETIVSELVENKDAVEVVVDEPNAEVSWFIIFTLLRTIWAELSASRAGSQRL